MRLRSDSPKPRPTPPPLPRPASPLHRLQAVGRAAAQRVVWVAMFGYVLLGWLWGMMWIPLFRGFWTLRDLWAAHPLFRPLHHILPPPRVSDVRLALGFAPAFIDTLARRLLGRCHAMAVWDEVVAWRGAAEAVRFGDQSFSFTELDRLFDAMGHWYARQGVQAGDVVAVSFTNAPAFLIAWYGAWKVGARLAMLPPELPAPSLKHALGILQPRIVVHGGDTLFPAQWAVLRGSPGKSGSDRAWGQQQHLWGPDFAGIFPYRDIAASLSVTPPPARLPAGPPPKTTDHALYIFTSGTTGFPKAAAISHGRFAVGARSMASALSIDWTDRIYVPLPLHHASAAQVGWGMAATLGCGIVLAPKFSVSRWWPDIQESGATVAQYVGEMMRYLMAYPPFAQSLDEGRPISPRGSRLRQVYGNGMKVTVWKQLNVLFPQVAVGEFYSSTEGNCHLTHLHVPGRDPDYAVGAIGRYGPLAQRFLGLLVVKLDEQGRPVRTPDGCCAVSPEGERGELVAAINEHDPKRQFGGYLGQRDATDSKILTKVRAPGDAYFRSGDAVMVRPGGYFYFLDRLGDTFRWQGENVSTAQVENVVGGLPAGLGGYHPLVYGVPVGDMEGKAGMMAFYMEEGDRGGKIDWKALSRHVRENLPPYAVPRFVRVLPREGVEMTATFKPKKEPLKGDGLTKWDANSEYYYWDRAGGYTPLQPQGLKDIYAGKIRI